MKTKIIDLLSKKDSFHQNKLEKKLSKIHDLDLSNSKISNAALKTLTLLLINNTTINTIDLRNNDINDFGTHSILKLLASNASITL